jgi:hypothetical protein
MTETLLVNSEFSRFFYVKIKTFKGELIKTQKIVFNDFNDVHGLIVFASFNLSSIEQNDNCNHCNNLLCFVLCK